jgi:hypothetical protein
MTMLGIGFPLGPTQMTEACQMIAGTGAAAYGDLRMIDESIVDLNTLKWTTMILPTTAGLLASAGKKFALCTERNGIAAGKQGSWVFVSDEIEGNFAAHGATVGSPFGGANGVATVTTTVPSAGDRYLGVTLGTATTTGLRKCRFDGWNYHGQKP